MRNAVIALVLIAGVAVCAGIYFFSKRPVPNEFPPKPDNAPVTPAKEESAKAAPESNVKISEAEKPEEKPEAAEMVDENEGDEEYTPKFIKVYGTVTDAASGQPIAGAAIYDESYKDMIDSVEEGQPIDPETSTKAGVSVEELREAIASGKPLREEAQKALEVAGTQSDASGAFTLTVDAMMEESILCSAKGYAIAARSVTENSPESMRIDFQMRPGAKVLGSVVNAADEKGVPGLRVAALPAATQSGPVWDRQYEGQVNATTGPDGAFVLEGLTAGAYEVAVDDRVHGWLFDPQRKANVTLAEGEEHAGIKLPVTEGLKIDGTVKDEKGEPIEGAMVTASPSGDTLAMLQAGQFYSSAPATTDASGHYVAIGIRTGKNIVAVEHEDYAGARAEVDAQPGSAALHQDFTLQKGFAVSGIAKYEDGTPAVDESLFLRKKGAKRDLFDPRSAGESTYIEEQDGSFTFAHVLPGEYVVTSTWMPEEEGGTEPPDAKSSVAVKVESKDVTDVQVTVKKEKEEVGNEKAITGKVLTPEGAPASDVAVKAVSSEAARFGGAQFGPTDTTDKDGVFTLDHGIGTEFTVSAENENGEASQEHVKPGDSITLKLGPATSVSGEVVNAQGEPVAGCSVALTEPDTGKKESMADTMQRMMGSMFGKSKDGVTTDDFGQFTIRHVAAGSYVAEAKSAGKGYGVSSAISVTKGTETKNVRITLDAGVEFAGVVVDGAGKPVQGANVSLIISHGGIMDNYMVNLPMGMGAAPEATATSDAQGAFTMSGLKKAKYTLSAKHADFAPFVAKDLEISGGQGSPYKVTLGKGGGVHGQLLADGKPRPNVMIQFLGPAGMQMATSDAEGRFEVKGMAAGSYMAIPIDLAGMRKGGDDAIPDISFKTVTITEGGNVEISFGSGVQVSGKIPAEMMGKMTIAYLMRPGAPNLPTMTPGLSSMDPAMEMMPYMAGFDMIGEDGSFSINGVDPGEYELRVYTSDFDMSAIKPEEMMNQSVEELQEQSARFQPKEMTRQTVTVGSEPMTVDVKPKENKG